MNEDARKEPRADEDSDFGRDTGDRPNPQRIQTVRGEIDEDDPDDEGQ